MHDKTLLSDLHKDAYGYRPCLAKRAQWAAMTDAELDVEWERMCDRLDREMARQAADEAAAAARFEADIAKLVAEHGIDRTTAILWDREAEGADDAGHHAYLRGLPWRYFEGVA